MSPVKKHMTRALRPTARKSASSDRISLFSFGTVVVLLTLLTIALPSVSSAQMSGFGGGDMFGGDDELVSVTPYFSISSAAPGKSYAADVRLTMLPGWHVNSAHPYQDWLIPAEVTFDTLDGITPHSIEYPEGHDTQLGGETISVYSGTTNIPFTITFSKDLAPGEYSLPVHVTYQPCNDAECRAPKTVDESLTLVVGTEGDPVHADIFGAVDQKTETPPPTSSSSSSMEENDLTRLINKYGFWGYILALGLAFVTGLLLSFSPCTYPMIPITVSIFAGQQRSLGRGFFLSLVYVGSMAVVYGIMGLIVSLVGGVFGAWLASPPVVIAIAIVFVIFSLSMFGLYELQVPSALRNKLGTRTKGGGIVGSLILGVVAALVVSPCVGPFVAGILIYVATSGSPAIGFLVLFVFAMGLGTLYIIIGTFSSAINALPNSGAWMESVKKFFGFVLLLMALYFVRTIIDPAITAILAGLLLTAFGVFGGGLDRLTSESGFFPRLKKFLGVLALLLGAYLLIGSFVTQGVILPAASHWLPAMGSGTATESSGDLIAWETDLDTGLKRAAQENKPVLIDTWATWCANCRVLDKKTFHHPDVAAAATAFVPIKVQLENANTAETKAFMKRFGMTYYSLPTTLLLLPDGSVKKVFRGVVEPDELIAEMKKLH